MILAKPIFPTFRFRLRVLILLFFYFWPHGTEGSRSHFGSVAQGLDNGRLALSSQPLRCETSRESCCRPLRLAGHVQFKQVSRFFGGQILPGVLLFTRSTCWRRLRRPACRTRKPPALRT